MALPSGLDPTVPVTPNKLYPLMPLNYTASGVGSDWGDYFNVFLATVLDLNLGGRTSPNVGGSSSYTVSAAQAQNLYHSLSGTITANIQYVLPNTGGLYLIYNGTSGNFSITVKPTGGSGANLIQGTTSAVFVNPDAATAYVFPLPSPVFGATKTITAASYTGFVSDRLLRFNCGIPSSNIAYTLPPLAQAAWPVLLKKIDASSLFSVNVGTNDGSLIEGNSTYSFNTPGQTVWLDPTSQIQWDII